MKYLKWYLYYAAAGTALGVAAYYIPSLASAANALNLANPVGKLAASAIAGATGKLA